MVQTGTKTGTGNSSSSSYVCDHFCLRFAVMFALLLLGCFFGSAHVLTEHFGALLWPTMGFLVGSMRVVCFRFECLLTTVTSFDLF